MASLQLYTHEDSLTTLDKDNTFRLEYNMGLKGSRHCARPDPNTQHELPGDLHRGRCNSPEGKNKGVDKC